MEHGKFGFWVLEQCRYLVQWRWGRRLAGVMVEKVVFVVVVPVVVLSYEDL